MSYLLDTCVLSEVTKKQPDPKVLKWLAATPDSAKYVSVISLGEIWFGILCSPAGSKREKLRRWYEREWRPLIGERVIPFGEDASAQWAALRAKDRNAAVIDAQLAATSMVHKFTFVTRNVRDFAFDGLRVFNPWSDR